MDDQFTVYYCKADGFGTKLRARYNTEAPALHEARRFFKAWTAITMCWVLGPDGACCGDVLTREPAQR